MPGSHPSPIMQIFWGQGPVIQIRKDLPWWFWSVGIVESLWLWPSPRGRCSSCVFSSLSHKAQLTRHVTSRATLAHAAVLSLLWRTGALLSFTYFALYHAVTSIVSELLHVLALRPYLEYQALEFRNRICFLCLPLFCAPPLTSESPVLKPRLLCC